MSKELEALIEKARHYVMTPQEKFEQRVSFVWGQLGHNDPRTKDQVREDLIKIMGHPSV